jgi:hypothetical protein
MGTATREGPWFPEWDWVASEKDHASAGDRWISDIFGPGQE